MPNTPLYEILALANKVLVDGGDAQAQILARYVVDHLGPLLECGYDSPKVNYNYQPARIDIPEYVGVPVDDVKGIVSAILSACDEASDG